MRYRHIVRSVLAWLLVGAVATAAAASPPVDDTPADVAAIVADPVLSNVVVSPSGRYVAMATREDGFDQLVVRDLTTKQSRTIMKARPEDDGLPTAEFHQKIAYVHWKTEDQLIVTIEYGIGIWSAEYVAPGAGQLVVDREGQGRMPVSLSPPDRLRRIRRSVIVSTLPKDPRHVLLSNEMGGVDRVDTRTGARTRLEGGGPRVLDYGADRQGRITTRLLIAGSTYFPYVLQQVRDATGGGWKNLWELHDKDLRAVQDIEILGSAEADNEVYVRYRPKSPADGDTYSIRKFNLTTKTLGNVVWRHDKYDADSVVVDEVSGAFLGGCYIEDVEICDFTDKDLDTKFKGIAKTFSGRANLNVVSQSEGGKTWVLEVSSPEEPASFYVFDAERAKLEPLGAIYPQMQAAGVVRRFDYTARDGLALSAYVTAPKATGRRPLVVMPHGGPEVRDSLEFNTFAQFLAGRGYEVLQPNFRGSSGFGRAFAQAGYGQWGGRMQDDVTDAVKALIATGEIDPDRVCIVGASYGGYAALYGAATQSGFYKCGEHRRGH